MFKRVKIEAQYREWRWGY